jgi:phytoene dehydrogenase-like protein
MADRFDAVLIGAGHNTLACALQLARKGWRVGLFEAASVAGGAVKTGEYTLPGFRHDWAAMNLSLFAGSAFFKENAAELAQNGVEFVPVNKPFASAFPDGRWCGVTTDMAATTAQIASFSKRDAETWGQLLAGFGAEAPHLFGLLGSPMGFRALAYFMFKTLRAKGVAGTLDMAQFLTRSPRDWLGRTFESPEVQAMLGAWGMHLDFAPDISGGALARAEPTPLFGRLSARLRRVAGWLNATRLSRASCMTAPVPAGSSWPMAARSPPPAR